MPLHMFLTDACGDSPAELVVTPDPAWRHVCFTAQRLDIVPVPGMELFAVVCKTDDEDDFDDCGADTPRAAQVSRVLTVRPDALEDDEDAVCAYTLPDDLSRGWHAFVEPRPDIAMALARLGVS